MHLAFEKINTLWELLEIALEDLKAVEADPRYAVDMGEWYSSNKYECRVCLAGAIIAKRLEIKDNPSMHSTETCSRLLAIDYLRRGKIKHAAGCMNIKCFMEIAKYNDKEQFHKDLAKLLVAMKAIDQ